MDFFAAVYYKQHYYFEVADREARYCDPATCQSSRTSLEYGNHSWMQANSWVVWKFQKSIRLWNRWKQAECTLIKEASQET